MSSRSWRKMKGVQGKALVAGGKTIIGIGLLWQAVVTLTGCPPYILPPPLRVLRALGVHAGTLFHHMLCTLAEIGLGLALGTALGMACALVMAWFPAVRRWLMPVIAASQSIPVFALAPLLVLWLGYGLGSKVAMTTLIIFFPITSSFLDGLNRTDKGLLDLAQVLGASRWAVLCHIRLPSALPALGSGLRMAAAVAPIGAVIGEWVGASDGLGYLMLHANARVQTDLMFAALLVLALLTVTLFTLIDRLSRLLVPWEP
ncbi:putative ABC transporter permease protein HI_0355 [uncultured Gammaproteobacteria bacterium]